MALTTLAGLLDLLAVVPARAVINSTSTTAVGSFVLPSSWSPGTPGTAGRICDNTDAGSVVPSVSGTDEAYLLTADCAHIPSGARRRLLVIVDLLWCNTGVSVATTSPQTWSPVALPSRASGGHGVEIGIICTAGGSSVVTDCTISYTDSAGTPGRTATCTAAAPSGGVPGKSGTLSPMVTYALQAGDRGVRSIEGITWGSLPSGTAYSLVLFRRRGLLSASSSPGGSDRESRLLPVSVLQPVTGECLLPLIYGSDSSSAATVATVSIGVG